MRIVIRHLREVIDLTGNKPVKHLLTKRQYRAKYGTDAHNRADVVLNRTNGCTVAVAFEDGKEIAQASARCGYNETFNRKTGTTYAVERLDEKLKAIKSINEVTSADGSVDLERLAYLMSHGSI